MAKVKTKAEIWWGSLKILSVTTSEEDRLCSEFPKVNCYVNANTSQNMKHWKQHVTFFSIQISELQESWDPDFELEAPELDFDVEWVSGYRGRETSGGSNALSLPSSGEICYSIAAVVVLYNMETHQQRHYMGHTNDVECIALHPRHIFLNSLCPGKRNFFSRSPYHKRMSDGLKVSIWNRFPIKIPNLNIRNRNNFLCYWSKANVFATSFQIQKWPQTKSYIILDTNFMLNILCVMTWCDSLLFSFFLTGQNWVFNHVDKISNS